MSLSESKISLGVLGLVSLLFQSSTEASFIFNFIVQVQFTFSIILYVFRRGFYVSSDTAALPGHALCFAKCWLSLERGAVRGGATFCSPVIWVLS